jgi:Xaa-Pro aminopeptidase
MEKMYDTLSQAQKAAMEMLRPGVKLSNVFNAGIDIVRKAGYPNYNRDFVGHSIGVELEEEPFITAKSEWVVEAGMVLAVEFPYYEEGMGGLNIEELVLVTKSGAKVLSDGLDRSIRVI